jgi:predicted ABC-type ATPase
MTVDEPAGSIWIINPDALAQQIADQENRPLLPDANLEAVRRIEDWLFASVKAHQTVGVETVLSTDKYRRLVSHARDYGFGVRLIYVFLESADLNVQRVRIRVSKGGHSVAEDRIRDRRRRSLEQFAWFFTEADRVDVFDNSGAEPVLVLVKADEEVTLYGDLIPEVVAAIETSIPGFAAAIEDDDSD